jgi:hypothetical protein
MLSVPVRAAPVFAATVKFVVPLPLADVVPTVIQLALEDAVQAHVLADAVTAIDPVEAASPTFTLVGEMLKLHGPGVGGGAGGGGSGVGVGVGVGVGGAGGTASCAIVTVSPAMATTPDRAPPLLAAMFSLTVPLVLPALVVPIVIQPAWLAAVQGHPVSVSTLKVTDPPDAETDVLAGETV